MGLHDLTLRCSATTLAVAMLFVVPTRNAQAQARVSGEWLVRYEQLMRSMHDAEPRVVNGTARMTLRVRGDSVFGYWQPPSDSGQTPRTPSNVRGTIHGDSVHVQIDPPPSEDGFLSELGRELVEFIKTYVHDMPPMTTHIDLIVHGDSLVGTRSAISADGKQ